MLQRVIAISCTLILSACITPARLHSVAITGPARIAAPQPVIGDAWSFNLINGFNGEVVGQFTEEVAGRTADGLTVRVTDRVRGTVTDERYTGDWNWIEKARPGLARLEYAPAFRAAAFPLEIGSTWQAAATATDRASGSRFPTRVWGKVEGWERIRVPAGEFDTVRVRRHVYHMDASFHKGNTRIDEVEWYAPAVGHWVRFESRSAYEDPSPSTRWGNGWVLGDWNVLELTSIHSGRAGMSKSVKPVGAPADNASSAAL